MSVLHYQLIPVTAFAQNCSLLWCDATREAAVIDPGGDLPRIEQAAQALGLKPGLLTDSASISVSLPFPAVPSKARASGFKACLRSVCAKGRMFSSCIR